jgi:hypothetical protein
MIICSFPGSAKIPVILARLPVFNVILRNPDKTISTDDNKHNIPHMEN